MKNLTKRTLSLLLALILSFSMLPAVTITADAATIDYVTGSTGSYSNVIKNWGSRGTTATFLSPNAEAFYTDTTYAELAALSGATSTSAVPSSELYLKLKAFMTENHDRETSYNDTRDLYAFTDCQNSDSSSISSFYSGVAIGPAWDGGSTWNREHTWPNSKGLNGNDENDIMMLRPTASSENSSRGNTAYGESSGYYDPNDVSGGTYNLHGDVARIMLYVYVRWGNTSNMWGSGGVMENLDVLLAWMEEDPVDTWEMGRNDSVESITGTRNVFVDYPELAFLLFGQAVPEMTTPSGNAAGSEYTITATVNDAAMGSAVVNGRTITAYPADGYYVVDYTLVSGDAVITRSGNIFTVSASSDCTICINFAARNALEVTYYENNLVAGSTTCYAGDSVTLPSYSGEVPDGYNFLGWVTDVLNRTADKPAAIYAAGSQYTVNEETEFYSLFSLVDTTSGETGDLYSLYTGEVTEGDYIIYYADEKPGAMAASQSASTKRLDYQEVTIISDMIENPDDLIVWHIAETSDGYVTIYNSSTGKYAAGTGTKNLMTLLSSVTDYAKWTPSGSGTYEFVNLGNKNAGVNCNLRKNNNYGFSCYSTDTGGALTLYKATSGTVYYSTYSCAHENTSNVPGVEPTCTSAGYTAGVICDDCGAYISGHESLGYAEHSWDEGTVILEATFEDLGEKEYTCTVCGETKTEEYEKPLIDLAGTTMTLGDSLELDFVIDISLLEEDGAYAEITRTYADGRESVTVTVAQADWAQYHGNLYYIPYDGIAAKEMGDTLSITVCNTFGTYITNPYSDSIKTYALRMLEKETNAELLTLLVDMLNYGAAAQKQFDYDTENFVNAELTAEQQAYATASYEMENNLASGTGRAGTTLTLKSRITLDFIFKNTAIGSDYTGLYAVATYVNHYGDTVETRIDTLKVFSDSYGYVSVPGLAIADYGQAVTCTIYDAQGNALAWATDSMEGYACRMKGSLPEIVDAIMKFCNSSYSYFH